ncbi:MAG: S-layer homology domain-containing protein, partial [Flavonifractor plautii]|nr:S-layer homology domain-containing protein [Flavonifractor plautii]MDY3701198.1 S-layer homology domain-containing protein [Flavonifractor plautii]
MRNLKRALSLALAAIMLIGMMVVSASAAGFDDFSDKDEIVNKDAVSMLTILGVINGKEDGSFFDPAGNVTRAEMAKMIATVLNQGADVDGLYVGMNTGLTDVKGHWAESYINYCYSLGIIAGRGNGKFDPAATVTGNEAAKMLLV